MSAFEQVARAKKVEALTLYLWTTFEPAARRDPETPRRLARMTTRWWGTIATLAEVNPPSLESRRQVVERIARLVNAERSRSPEPPLQRVCLQCFAVLDCKPYPAPAPLHCQKCDAQGDAAPAAQRRQAREMAGSPAGGRGARA